MTYTRPDLERRATRAVLQLYLDGHARPTLAQCRILVNHLRAMHRQHTTAHLLIIIAAAEGWPADRLAPTGTPGQPGST